MLEQTVQADRKKFYQLVDLIKDLWQSEIESNPSNGVTLATN